MATKNKPKKKDKIAKAKMPKVVYLDKPKEFTFEVKLVKYLNDGSSIVETILNGGAPHREYINEGQTLSFKETI